MQGHDAEPKARAAEINSHLRDSTCGHGCADIVSDRTTATTLFSDVLLYVRRLARVQKLRRHRACHRPVSYRKDCQQRPGSLLWLDRSRLYIVKSWSVDTVHAPPEAGINSKTAPQPCPLLHPVAPSWAVVP